MDGAATNTGFYIYMIIEAVVLLIPIATLIWRASTMASRITQAEKDIGDLRNQMDSKVDKLISDVNDMKILLAEIRTEQKVKAEQEARYGGKD